MNRQKLTQKPRTEKWENGLQPGQSLPNYFINAGNFICILKT